MDKFLMLKDWVLVFFYANTKNNKKTKIDGRPMLNNQFLVFVKEIKPELDKHFRFIPGNYGPSSYPLNIIIDKLTEDNLIKQESCNDYTSFDLTDDGKKYAKNLYEKIEKPTSEKLEKLRYDATESGYEKTVYYLVSRYSEFTNKFPSK